MIDCGAFSGPRCGDFLEDPGLGVAGGGIKTSDKYSGEMDPDSEVVWLAERARFSLLDCRGLCWSATLLLSIMLAISFGGIVVLDDCFLRCGFIDGDSLTVRGVALPEGVGYFFFDLFATEGEAPAEIEF